MLKTSHTANRSEGGFTLVSLLMVVAIGTLLTATLSSALNNNRLKNTQFRCANNLRQLGVAARLYAEDDARGRFPDCNGGVWPWDLPAVAATGLINYGARSELLYCPDITDQDYDVLWRFTANPEGTSGFRVIGYALAFRGAGRVLLTNITDSINPAPYRINNRDYQPPPSERVLSADAILSLGANETDRKQNRYDRIFGGSAIPHRSPHLDGRMPAGGNLVFLDGHTAWRRFSKMRVRTDGNPPFWW